MIVVVEEGVGIVPGKERERLVEGRPQDRVVPALGDVAVGIVGVVDGPGPGDGVRLGRRVGVADPVLGEDVADVVVGDGPRRLPAHLALGQPVEVVILKRLAQGFAVQLAPLPVVEDGHRGADPCVRAPARKGFTRPTDLFCKLGRYRRRYT